MPTERDTLLRYIAKLSDERIHRLLGKAQAEYSYQKDTEEINLTEKSLCAGVLAQLDSRVSHFTYVFAKALLAEQEKEADRRKDEA